MEQEESREFKKKRESKYKYAPRVTNAELYQQMCLTIQNNPKIIKKLFHLLLEHQVFRDENGNLITDVYEKEIKWEENFGKPTIDNICKKLSDLFIMSPHLLEADLFTEKLPPEIRVIILDMLLKSETNYPYNYLLVSKNIRDTIKTLDKFRILSYKRLFGTSEGEAKFLAATVLYLLKRPEIVDNLTSVDIQYRCEEEKSQALVIISIYSSAFWYKTRGGKLPNRTDGKDFVIDVEDVAVIFNTGLALTMCGIPDKAFFGSADEYINKNHMSLHTTFVPFGIQDCFNWLTGLFTVLIDMKKGGSRGEKRTISGISIKTSHLTNPAPQSYPFIYPFEIPHIKDNIIQDIKVQDLPKAARDALGTLDIKNISDRRFSALLTQWEIPEVRHTLGLDILNTLDPRVYPADLIKRIYEKYEKNEPFTDTDIIEYIYYKSYPREAEKHEDLQIIARWTFNEDDLIILFHYSDVFTVMAGMTYRHILETLHISHETIVKPNQQKGK